MTVPAVVQFGAGNIGRGFTGQLFTESGYEVVFVDVDPALVDALQERRSYPLRLVESDRHTDLTIAPVRAVDGRDAAAVASELAQCAFACTAVGVNVFAHLAPVIAAGIIERSRTPGALPLNVLCCENQSGAGVLLRSAVASRLPDDAGVRSWFDTRVAFVDSSVGRMVPIQAPELRAEDPLLVAAEAYKELPIDASAWIGPVPAIVGMKPRTAFAGYVARKLYTHNGGHALLAYLGHLRGCSYIWEAPSDPALVPVLEGAWAETGAALVAEYGFDAEEQAAHQSDLLRRFRNRALGDTVARVARDPRRKLRGDDRLVGGALLCLKHGIEPVNVCRGIAAALRYDAPDDPTAAEVRTLVSENGVAGALIALGGLEPESPLIAPVEKAYAAL